MRRIGLTGLATTIAAGACLAVGSAHAQARNPFDGNWSVQVVTERGDCDRAYRYPIVVENGRARYGGPEAFAISGSISAKGAVRVSISRGQDRADASGSASGKWATGTWKTSGSRNCSGSWNAEKRG